jgi:hypothetical protein
MQDSKYNGMFSVSQEKTIFYNDKTGETHSHAQKESSQYDLPNGSTYDMDGNLISEAGQISYNSIFFIMLIRARILEVKPFLDHHFNFTSDQEAFLDYLEFGLLESDQMKSGTKGIASKWIEERRKSIKDYPGPIKMFLELIDELRQHHISTVNGFLDFKFGHVPKDFSSQSYWLFELHKHLFWFEKDQKDLDFLNLLKWAHKWQEVKHRNLIIDFNNRVNGVPNPNIKQSLNFENWLNGKFTLKGELIKKLDKGAFVEILNHSGLLIKEQGEKETNRLILNFEKRLVASDNSKDSLIKEIAYYSSLLSHEIKDSDQGYLVPETYYSDCVQYDCQFVKKVQKKRAHFVSGRINDLVPNPKEESYNSNGDEDVYCTVTAIAWVKYLEYINNKLSNLKGIILKKSKKTKASQKISLDYNINHWNKECFDLFNYLNDNYNATAKKQKFINIWFYLEYNTSDTYIFNYPKEEYKQYITANCGIDFTKSKMNKPANFESQLLILNTHFSNHCNKLKAL